MTRSRLLSIILFVGLLALVPLYASERSVSLDPSGFDFPTRPGTDGWEKLGSKTERVAALQIPYDLLGRMSTEKLVALTLDYPFLIDLFAFEDLDAGLETKAMEWNGLRLLFVRPDAADALLGRYEQIDLGRAALHENALETAPLAEVEAAMAERLMLHPRIFEDLLVRHPRRYAAALTEKIEARLDGAGLYGPGPIATKALRRVLDEADLEEADRLAFTNRALLPEAKANPPSGCGSFFNVTLYTPRCTPVCAHDPGNEWPNVSTLNSLYQSAYSGIATFMASVSKRYFCHTWAFHMTEYTTYPTHEVTGGECPGYDETVGHPYKVQILNVGDIKRSYLCDGSYTEVTTTPSQATKAVYATKLPTAPALTGTTNHYDHSGIISSGCPNAPNSGVASNIRNICLDSKWGISGPRMKHLPGNDPYTAPNPLYDQNGNTIYFGMAANRLDLRLYKRTVGGPQQIDASPNSQSFSASSGTKSSVVATTPSTGTWTATDNRSWISVSPTSGGNNGNVSITVQSNSSSSSRSGTVTVTLAGTTVTDTISVTQSGAVSIPAKPYISVYPSPHCLDAFETYGVTPVAGATSYQWRTTSSGVDIFGLGNGQNATVNAWTFGWKTIYVKACNSAGCSAERSRGFSPQSCGAGGGPY